MKPGIYMWDDTFVLIREEDISNALNNKWAINYVRLNQGEAYIGISFVGWDQLKKPKKSDYLAQNPRQKRTMMRRVFTYGN